jgi:hypothetical protein
VCILDVKTRSCHFVVAEVGCNLYLLDINILSFVEKAS